MLKAEWLAPGGPLHGVTSQKVVLFLKTLLLCILSAVHIQERLVRPHISETPTFCVEAG
jgi:hypothetical protein